MPTKRGGRSAFVLSSSNDMALLDVVLYGDAYGLGDIVDDNGGRCVPVIHRGQGVEAF